MILDLIRLGGGSVVHAQEVPGKALCDDRTYTATIASWQGDASEIRCPKCKALLADHG